MSTPSIASYLVHHGPTGERFVVDVEKNPDYKAHDDIEQKIKEQIQEQIAVERGWNPDDIEVEHCEPLLAEPVTFVLMATNTATGKRRYIELITMHPDATSAHEKARMRFMEEVKKQSAGDHGWDVSDTEIEYAEPLLDQR